MARNVTESETDERQLPNRATIVGRGVPSQFELTVSGEIEASDDATRHGAIVTESAVEGTVDVGVVQFHFTGELANVRLVDWNGTPAPESASTPTVHVEYGVSR